MSSESLPGPSWPADCWISPTALNLYRDCPRRVRLQYIEKLAHPKTFNLYFAKGNAAHDLLRHGAKLLQRGLPLPDQAWVLDAARKRLPANEFPTGDAREEHARDITRWVKYGYAYLDPEAEYIVIEQNGKRPITLLAGLPAHTLVARSDVVLIHTDESGERWVEFIDYKTGKQKEIETVPVFTRFVHREVLKRSLGDPTTTRMKFTFLWLEMGEPAAIDLSLEYCNEALDLAKGTLVDLVTEHDWPARPSEWNCRYCPYNGHPCTAFTDAVIDPVPFSGGVQRG